MQLYLIRHGQSENNARPEHMRVEDAELTELGHQQARHLAPWIATLELDRLFCSPFRRALQTAWPLMQQAGLETINKLNKGRLELINDPEIASRMNAYELAFRMQAAAPELIDLSSESKQTLDNYGVTRAEPEKNSFRGGGPDVYTQFSTNCLLARRLVERGVRCVTVMHASWDHHSNLDKEITYNAGMLDQPAAALVKDLKQRGLLDETLVICAGEFGRTPRISVRPGTQTKVDQPGRDHWPSAMSMLVAGGGMRTGQVIGATNTRGEEPVQRPLTPNDLWASVYKHLGINPEHTFPDLSGRPMPILPFGEAIHELNPVS